MPSWIDSANRAPTLIERMRALLAADDAVSFAELAQLDGFGGDGMLFADAERNLVLWPSVSAQAVDDLAILLSGGECHLGPAGLLTYCADGAFPRLPMAERRGRYARPHWVPAVLMQGPAPAPAPRPRRRHSTRDRRGGLGGPRKRQLVPGKLQAGR